MKRHRILGENSGAESRVLKLSLSSIEETESWSHTYIGQTGIKVRIRLATCLQPINWESSPPPFVSCLESWNKSLTTTTTTKSSLSSMKLRRGKQGNDSSSVVKRGQDHDEDELVMYLDVDFGAHGELLSAAPTPKQTAPLASPPLPIAPVLSSRNIGTNTTSGVHMATRASGGAGSIPNLREISFSPLPVKVTSSSAAAAVSATSGGMSGSKRSRGNSLTSEHSHHNPIGHSAESVTDSTDLDLLEDLHRQALMIDLQSAPINTKSWLTSTMIDALLYRFARSFPDVSFLPCSFAAFELPQALRKGNLSSLIVRDVLGRKIPLESEPFGPVTSVLGYNPLPTKTFEPIIHQVPMNFSSSVSTSLSSLSVSTTTFTNIDKVGTSIKSESNYNSQNSGIISSKGIKLRLVTSRTATRPVNVFEGDGDLLTVNTTSRGGGGITTSPISPPSTQPIITSSRSRGVISTKPSSSLHLLQVASTSSFSKDYLVSELQRVPWDGLLTSERPSSFPLSCPIAPSYTSKNKPLLFFYNAGGMHWVFVRVLMGLRKRIELYEPMGKPQKSSARSGGANGIGFHTEGLSLRSVPRPLVQWLDTVCPLATDGGWKVRSLSAVTRQHQVNGFDCGVACLLYAEKSAQNFEAETICNGTEQTDITAYRKLVVNYCNVNASINVF